MGSAHRLLKETVLFLAAALGIAMPGRAQFQLIVSSTTVNLNDNQARSITVTAPGTTPLTYTVSGVPFWLSAFSANNFTTPDVLSFQLTNTNCGICMAAIMLVPVTPPGIEAPVSVTVITVTYAPGGTGGGGTLVASPASLTFSAASGQSAAAQNVTLTTSSSSAINIAGIASDQTSWLSAAVSSGSFSISSNSPATLTVRASAAALLNGVYTGHITITPSIGTATVITVTFNVGTGGGSGGPLSVNPTALTFTASPGGASQSQNLAVSAAGNATVQLNITSFNGAFYSVSSPACGGTPNPAFSCIFTGNQGLTITVNPANLVNLGLYSGTLTFQSGGSTVTVPLTMNLTAPVTTLTVTPTALSFTAAAGSAAQTQSVTVAVPDTAFVQASITSFNGNFFSVTSSSCNANLANPTCGFSGNQTLNVTVNPATLTNPGTYNGNILLQSGGSSVNVTVSLTLTSSGTGGGNTGAIAAPASLAFAYQMSSAGFIPQQVITVGPVGTFAATANVSTTQQWLIISTVGITGPGFVIVSVSPQGLAAGTYTGTITIASASGTMSIPVTLTVTANVVVEASPGNVYSQYQAGSPAIQQGITLVASDNSATPVTASTSTPWIAVGAQTSSTTPASFTLTMNPSGLCNGLNTGSVTVSAPNAANNGFTIPVVMLVSGSTVTAGCPTGGGPPLLVGPPALLFVAPANGVPPPAQNLTVTAVAPTTSYTVSTSVQGGVANWLNVLPSGTLVGSQTLVVLANQAGLGLGAYTGTISLTANGIVQTVPVTLVVGPPGGVGSLVANPPTLTFDLVSGQSTSTAYITLSTTSTTPITIVGVSTDSPNFLSAVLTTGNTVTSANPAAVFVTATALRLPAGSFTGHITVTPSIGPPTTITVTLIVGTGSTIGTIVPSPPNLTFSAPSGQTAAAQPVVLTTANTNPVSILTIVPDVSWLSATVSSVTVSFTSPATMRVLATATGIAPGFYVGHLTINPSVGVPTIIAVIFLVAPPPGGAGPNLALGRVATQSSTLPGYPTAIAAAAVDNNTDGNFFDGSVTATDLDPNPWWQVDLGISAMVNTIVVWNRTDCCGSRLNDYWVFVSDTPFLPTDTPATLQSRAGTFTIHQTNAPNPSTPIPVGAQGRYVRVQLTNSNYLSLAEVQVFGTPPPPPLLSNLAQGKAATQSSTLPGYPTAGAAAVVDGNTDGNFFDGSVSTTNLDPNAWWQVDLGASANILSITIWNRTDCCGSRLSDYWVFVSDTPFLPTDTPATLQFRAGTFSSHQINAPNPSTLIVPIIITPVPQARYVRVQLSGTDYLSLAEVQVFGIPAPVVSNLAQGKAAIQSSTFPGSPTAGAASAVDGNLDGNFFDGSVTATNLDPNAWWQVDLGASPFVNSVVIWNRTDCCSARLSDYWVFVSDIPFLPTDTPATLLLRTGTFSSHQTVAPNPSTPIAAGARGRYVRVQLTGTDYLSLAEVQVFGQ